MEWIDLSTGQITSPPVLGRDVKAVGTLVSGRLPTVLQARNSVMYRVDQAGQITNYQIWRDDGLPAYRVDLQGAAHGGIAPPHTIYFPRNATQSGQSFSGTPSDPIPSSPQEVP